MKIIKETEGGQNAALNPGDLERIGALACFWGRAVSLTTSGPPGDRPPGSIRRRWSGRPGG